MADIVRCVNDLIAAGKLSTADGDAILGSYERASAAFGLNGYPPGGVSRAAAVSALRTHRASLAQRRRQRALQLIAQADVERLAASHPRGMGEGLRAVISRDRREIPGLVSVETRAGGLERLFNAQVGEGLAKLRTQWFGLARDERLLNEVYDELHGTATGNADAAAIAKAFADVAERARVMFNENGGAIPKRSDWGWTHGSDPRRVAAVDRNVWIEDTMRELDRDKMLGSDQRPLADDELRLLLDGIYDKISTDGLSDLVPGARGSSKLSNQHQDHRFLVFKDGPAFRRYHEKYGSGDLFANLTGHLHSMAHEIALLEQFGPNPETTFRHVRDLALRNGDLQPGSITDRQLMAEWNVTTGKVGAAVSPALAETMTAARNFLAATRLGSAALSAVADIHFVRQTLAWNGLPMARYLKEFTGQLMELPAGERQRMAVRMGLGAEAFITRGLAANRFAEVTGPGLTAKMADVTMRATGLSKWTDAGLKGVGLTVLGELGERSGAGMADLPPDLAKLLQRFRIDAQAWDDIRAHGLIEPAPGAQYVDFQTLMESEALEPARRLDLSRRLLEMTYEISQLAVPHPGTRTRGITSGGAARGTVASELWRSFAQFKTFPIEVINGHIMRGVLMTGAGNKAKYAGGLIIGSTLAGAVVVQMKEISKGRDPRDMNAPEFWGASFLQGGGAGIYGDFVYSGMFGQSRFGRSLFEELSGPMVGMASDVLKLTAGNVGQTLTGEDPKFVGEAIRFASQNVPLLSSGWYTRLAFERMVTDQLRLAADPTSQRQMTRAIRNRQAEYSQEYWWQPGQAMPERGPDLGQAVGE